MVPHKSTGFSPFQLLYSFDPLMPKEILFTTYDSEENYKVTLSSHIQNILATNQQALINNQQFQDSMHKWFDRKFVCKHMPLSIGHL